MSEQNVEVVRAGYEAFNRRDFEAALALGHESITWRPVFSVETYVLKGKQEILAAWKSQTEALDVEIDVSEVTPLDETRVLAVGTWRGRGSGSGAPFERTAAQVFTVEDGRIRSVESYGSRADALEAAGSQK
jgi:ketosteroid isomerase-like protein